jgi:hypothetical protein
VGSLHRARRGVCYRFFVSYHLPLKKRTGNGVIEKRQVNKFPAAPVSVLLANVDKLTGEEHDWNPINYDEEVQPYAIGRFSLKRFPVLAFESSDADFIAENLNSVIQNCQNDRE